jgi:hypothetical protein
VRETRQGGDRSLLSVSKSGLANVPLWVDWTSRSVATHAPYPPALRRAGLPRLSAGLPAVVMDDESPAVGPDHLRGRSIRRGPIRVARRRRGGRAELIPARGSPGPAEPQCGGRGRCGPVGGPLHRRRAAAMCIGAETTLPDGHQHTHLGPITRPARGRSPAGRPSHCERSGRGCVPVGGPLAPAPGRAVGCRRRRGERRGEAWAPPARASRAEDGTGPGDPPGPAVPHRGECDFAGLPFAGLPIGAG